MMQIIFKKQTMKKLITLSLAFSALVFTAAAQEQKKDNKNKTERHEGRGDRKGIMKDLNLTDVQKTQMKANREEFKTKMEQLKAQNLPEAQYNERKKALHAEQKARMESMLTAEQKAKMAERRKNFEGKEGKFEGKNTGKQGKHFEKMKKELSLTDDQAVRLKAQNEALKIKREAIKNDQSLSKEAKKEKMMALRNEAKEQRKSILTADQIKKMEELKKDRKDKGSRKARK
jgi:Spy/CpxP family protein refolding chaperone